MPSILKIFGFLSIANSINLWPGCSKIISIIDCKNLALDGQRCQPAVSHLLSSWSVCCCQPDLQYCVQWGLTFHSSIFYRRSRKNCQLTLDFGPFSQPKEPPEGSLFHRIRSEMLKRKERMALRRKPIQYEKLQLSLQEKLKQKTFNREEQRDQLVMLQKCKNYFQLRKHDTLTPKPTRVMARPHTSCASVHKSNFMSQLQGVMRECGNDEGEIKEDMRLFTYYCKMMDRRLEGIKNTIEKKERMA